MQSVQVNHGQKILHGVVTHAHKCNPTRCHNGPNNGPCDKDYAFMDPDPDPVLGRIYRDVRMTADGLRIPRKHGGEYQDICGWDEPHNSFLPSLPSRNKRVVCLSGSDPDHPGRFLAQVWVYELPHNRLVKFLEDQVAQEPMVFYPLIEAEFEEEES